MDGMTDTTWVRILWIADWVLIAFGTAVILFAATYWLIFSRRDPLGAVAGRPNSVLLDAMLVPVAAWLLAGSIAASVAGEGGSGVPGELARLATDHAAGICGALACLWVSRYCFRGGVRAFLIGDGAWRRPLVAAVALMLAATALCLLAHIASLAVFSKLIPDYLRFDHEIIVRIHGGEVSLWAVWIGTAVIAPITEECFFRGVFQTGLVNVLKRRWLGVILTAAVFGAVHTGGASDPQPHVVLPLAVLGVLLGVLYLRTGSLVGPIVLHALFNAKTLLWETLPRLIG